MIKKPTLLKITKLALVFLFFSFLPFTFSFAGEDPAETEVIWPTSPVGTEFTRDMPLHELIAYFYEWGIVIGILAVFGILVFAGFQYTISAGKPAMMTDALSRIQAAIIGLVLLLSSWLILSIINPELVKISPITFSISDEIRGLNLDVDDLYGAPVDAVEFYPKKNYEGDIISTLYTPKRSTYEIRIEQVHYLSQGGTVAAPGEGEAIPPESARGFTAIPPSEMIQWEQGIDLDYQRYSHPPLDGVLAGTGSYLSFGQKMIPDPEGLYKEGGSSLVDLYEETTRGFWDWLTGTKINCESKLSRGIISTVDVREGIFGFDREINCMIIERRHVPLDDALFGSPGENAVRVSPVFCDGGDPCFYNPPEDEIPED